MRVFNNICKPDNYAEEGMMKRRLALPVVVCAIVFWGGPHVTAPLYPEPIEPTRTLQGGANQPGLLSVYSEPPAIDLWVDGKKMGKTPVTSIQLQPGEHLLRLGDSEQKISITSGRSSTYSWFKGALIEVADPSDKSSSPPRDYWRWFPVCSPLQLFPSMVWASISNQPLWGGVEQETNHSGNQRSAADPHSIHLCPFVL